LIPWFWSCRYMKHQLDDSPLYIFDSTFDDDKNACVLLDDYRVPSYFPDDFFSLVGERRRPPYRCRLSIMRVKAKACLAWA
jgi:hypothetical protein